MNLICFYIKERKGKKFDESDFFTSSRKTKNLSNKISLDVKKETKIGIMRVQ